MRHQVAGRKLGRTTSHRWALFRNLANSLVQHERIETTLFKAKELRTFADHLITLGKQDDLAARRNAFNFLRSQNAVSKLFSDLAPRFKDRNGGFTRILKLGYRLGDSAPMALIEYLPETKEQAEGKVVVKKSVEAKAKGVKKAKALKKEAPVKKEASAKKAKATKKSTQKTPAEKKASKSKKK